MYGFVLNFGSIYSLTDGNLFAFSHSLLSWLAEWRSLSTVKRVSVENENLLSVGFISAARFDSWRFGVLDRREWTRSRPGNHLNDFLTFHVLSTFRLALLDFSEDFFDQLVVVFDWYVLTARMNPIWRWNSSLRAEAFRWQTETCMRRFWPEFELFLFTL